MKQKKLRVYVAGAYSDTNVLRVLRNIGRGQYWSAALFQAGLAPFTPWHDKEFVISNWMDDFEVKDLYEYSMEWLSVSDAVFVVPNYDGLKTHQESHGTQEEIKTAESLNIPVFYDVDKLLDYATNKGFTTR